MQGGKEACLNARACVQDVIDFNNILVGDKKPWVVMEKSEFQKMEYSLPNRLFAAIKPRESQCDAVKEIICSIKDRSVRVVYHNSAEQVKCCEVSWGRVVLHRSVLDNIGSNADQLAALGGADELGVPRHG